MGSMTIGKKLFASLGAALALTLAVSGLALWNVGSLGGSLDNVSNSKAMKRFIASDINTTMSDFLAEERGVLARSFLKDKAGMEGYNQQFDESRSKFKKRVDQFMPLVETEQGRRGIQE